jgi:hypothetical protein
MMLRRLIFPSRASAKQPMEYVACTWEVMADDLEKRLSNKAED